MDRFWKKVDKSGDCWLWTATKIKGYGQIHWNGIPQYAHRVAYTELVGKIPDGFQIDHTCFNRSCVNPSHLEAVTGLENNRRARAHYGLNDHLGQIHRSKTHCPQGHEYNVENTYWHKNTKGGPGRKCRMCATLRKRRQAAFKQLDKQWGILT